MSDTHFNQYCDDCGEEIQCSNCDADFIDDECEQPTIKELLQIILDTEGVTSLTRELTEALVFFAPQLTRGISTPDLNTLYEAYKDEFTRTTR